MPDTDSTLSAGGAGRSRLRSGVLTGAAGLGLVLGGAGALALDTNDAPARWTGATLAQTDPNGADKLCPERDAAGVTLLRFAAQDAPAQPEAGAELSVADVAEQANPAVVTITVLSGGFGAQAVPVGAGSGFIIDAEGHVVTNNHVVAGAEELSVEFFDGTTTTATVVGRDPVQDVAVIQLDLADGEELPGTVAFGDSDAVRPGDRVVAIGSSLCELTNTVSDGTVCAVDRELFGTSNLIQHDAEICPGNSGGPLLNLQGEVVGVNVAGIGGTQGIDVAPARIGFAIASNAVEEIAAQLIANGEIPRPFLGITGEPIDGGQAVIEVSPGTPADEAGLQEGDVITAINGEAIEGRTSLLDLLLQYAPGDTVTLSVERDGTAQEIEIVLGERPLDLE